MLKSIFDILLLYYKWLIVIEGAYVVVIGAIALLALLVNVFQLIIRRNSAFRSDHFIKVILATGAVAFYYYVYQTNIVAKYLEHQQPPFQAGILVIVLLLPIGIVQASDMIFAGNSKPKKKK